MKYIKYCAASVLALLAADAAFAATTIKITGSTAYRKATTAAIINSLDTAANPVTGAVAPQAAADAADISSATRAVITGTLKSTHEPVVIQTAWAGSVGGVATLDGNLETIPGVTFVKERTWLKPSLANQGITVNASYAFSARTGSALLSATTLDDAPLASTFFDDAATADVAMSDTFQPSTDFNATELTDTTVGVVTFAWTKGKLPAGADAALTAAYARLTNIASAQAVSLLANGDLPLSMLTGNALDEAYLVVLIGRNNDSGTRLTAFAESGFGISSPTIHYKVDIATGLLTVVGTTDGYSSSSEVKTALNTALPSSAKLRGKNYILVSYTGTGTVTSQQLTHNGVTFSTAATAEGQYTFWGYEHILTRGNLTGAAAQFVTDVTDQLTNTDAVANGVLLSTMQVGRTSDGGQINSNL